MPDDPTTPDAATIAGLLDRPDPFRATADVDLAIPLGRIRLAPWNPKPTISGVYRSGLAGSLGEFALRDRIKVWPDPEEPGGYLVLDGNQRVDVLREMAEDHLLATEAATLVALEVEGEAADANPAPDEAALRRRSEQALKALRADAEVMARVRATVDARLVPCRVLAELSPGDAELFTLAFNRNQAKFDEAKVADLVARQITRVDAAGFAQSVAARSKDLLARIARPERVVVPPPPMVRPASPTARPHEPHQATPEASAVAEEPARGPSPDVLGGTTAAPQNPTSASTADAEGLPPATDWRDGPLASTRPRASLVPVVFNLTPETHAELTDGLLKSTSRFVRAAKLQNVAEQLLAVSDDTDLSEAFLEVALVVFQRRIAIDAKPEN